MMACRKILQKQQWTYVKRLYPMFFSQASTQEDELIIDFDKRLPSRIEKKPAKKPFVKSLLLGKFDSDMMSYPESQNTERNRAFFEWLKPIEEFMQIVDAKAIDRTKNIPKEIIDKLNEFDVFQAYIKEDYGGIELLEAEYIKLIETLSLVPAIGLYVIKLNRCVDLLQKYASVEQKLRYIPKIGNGLVVPTVCISETKNVVDTSVIKMQTFISNDDQEWVVNGEKIFVPYADKANLFLLFTLCCETTDPYKVDEKLSVLLIDKPSNNSITMKPVDIVGIRGLPHFTVDFNDVSVPLSCMIGNIGDGLKMFTEYHTIKKHDTGGVAVGILKNFVNKLIHYMTYHKHFNKMLFEYDSAREVLGKSVVALYGMESMTYMTASLIDLYTDQDCTVESAIVQTHCAKQCIKRLSEGIHLIGTPAYLTENEYDLFFRDAQALTVFENSIIDNETYAVLMGLQHVGKEIATDIKQLKNPFQYPMFNLLSNFYTRKLKVEAANYLHPSLVNSAECLEHLLYQLKACTTRMLSKHGLEISNNHMDLRRLYDIMAQIYCLICILSRASKAYCIGLRNAEQEIHLANYYAVYTLKRVKRFSEEFESGAWSNGDKMLSETAQLNLEKKSYFAEHPMTRNY